jgi:NAD(P)-dependent dehydrogenase (short-subunit alcohol dehydrogenase family)
MGCFAGFLMGREVAKAMLPRGRGTILFTGATASLRGREGFAAFAGAKHALRALAQSMARELWPQGIHVAHPVIDGAIDTEFIRSNFPERYALKERQGILNPEHIADLYWQIHCSRATPGRTRPNCGPGPRPGDPVNRVAHGGLRFDCLPIPLAARVRLVGPIEGQPSVDQGTPATRRGLSPVSHSSGPRRP